MTRDVLVTITGIQQGDLDEDTIQTEYRGHYRLVNQRHIISYKEQGEAATEEVSCLLKADARQIILTKKTTPVTEMVFCPGQRVTTLYQTPMGAISMGIATDTIQLTENTEKIRIEIAYHIFLEETLVSDNRLIIEISN